MLDTPPVPRSNQLNPPLQLTGVHHVSSLTSRIEESHSFHTRVLGLRLLLKTVNQDDPGMYHLFLGDGAGTPGSDLTLFDLPGAVRERRGNNSISRTTFRVSGQAALEYWVERLKAFGIAPTGPYLRDGRSVIDFDDPVGTALSLVDDGGEGEAFPWEGSPVPAPFQIRGLGYLIITVPDLTATDRFLTLGLGFERARTYPLAQAPGSTAAVYLIGSGGAAAQLHVEVRADLLRARYGSGGVHHLALRLTPGDRMEDWVERLNSLGYANSGVVDRHYFISTYVREPNGVLFELATDEPGFEVDAPIDGNRLSLPPFLEPQRREIEARLRPLGNSPAVD